MKFEVKHNEEPIDDVKFSPDGRYVATGSHDNWIDIYLIEDPDERKEILEGFGLGEGALFRMVRSAYHLLGLRTYMTTGEQESRAWTFHEGSTAPVCAGRIHGDFQRGFIRAEVIQWDELLELGSWNAAKDVGKMRVEGKDYIAQDGDVMEFRFNV